MCSVCLPPDQTTNVLLVLQFCRNTVVVPVLFMQVQLASFPFRFSSQQLSFWRPGRLCWGLCDWRQAGQTQGAHASSLLVW